MESTETNNVAPGNQNEDNTNQGEPREQTTTGSGAFINNDQASDSSIGPGTSDQGIEPGEEAEEDEFRKNISGSPGGAGFADGVEVSDEKPRQSSKGLVEEGPGPDS